MWIEKRYSITGASRSPINLSSPSWPQYLCEIISFISFGYGNEEKPVHFFTNSRCLFRFPQESRTTRTIARSFVPEFNHSIDFPVQLIWTDHRQHRISLAEMLEQGELKVDLYHQMNPSDTNEKQKIVDIPLCTCTISLRELVSRHTGNQKSIENEMKRERSSCDILGIKGWFPLASVQRVESADITERCVGGLELFIRFAQQDDRRRILDSAKMLGWIDGNSFDDEHFLEGEKKSTETLIFVKVEIEIFV